MARVYTVKGKGKIIETSADKTEVKVEQKGGPSDGKTSWWLLSELG